MDAERENTKLPKIEGYLHTYKCDSCGGIYGSDFERDNGRCPECRAKKRGEGKKSKKKQVNKSKHRNLPTINKRSKNE